ncbi:MAG: UbiD family decarboxylase [Candidatus Caldarchaeum sp.]|nr:UbiD family decarboxylase [Candidatus Caldarchaeum sp.]
MPKTRHQDLRDFMKILEERNELRVVENADPELEIGILTMMVGRRKHHPSLLFDAIKGYRKGFRIITNLITTEARNRLAAGIEPELEVDNMVEFLAGLLKEYQPVKPTMVSDGPVMSSKMVGDRVDLGIFPSPLWHEFDGGRYIGTGTVVLMKDPENGFINLGTYRIQLHDKKTLGISISPGHHGGIIRDKYWERGLSCPVVISFGHDPTLGVAADLPASYGESELDYAGWLRGRPVEVIEGPLTGLPIPSTSELVVEGEIPPLQVESRVEGPFGEFGGYYSVEERPQPVVRVKAVYFREDPVIDGRPPYRGVRHDGPLPFNLAFLLKTLRDLGYHDVRKIGRVGAFLVVSLKVRYAGQVRQVADLVMSGIGMRPPKYLMMVDEDIDPDNFEDVMWAFQSRVDPEDSIHLVRNRWTSLTDPRVPPEKKAVWDITSSSLIIDATRPWGWRDKFPKPTEPSKNTLNKYYVKWKSFLDSL